MRFLKNTLILVLTIFSIQSLANSIRNSYLNDWEFKLQQLEYQFSELDKLSRWANVNEDSLSLIERTLSERGLSPQRLNAFGEYVVQFLSGNVSVDSTACGTELSFTTDSSQQARISRYMILLSAGDRALYSLIEMRQLAKAIEDEIGIAERIDTNISYKATCDRIKSLHQALRVVAQKPADFILDDFNAAVSRSFPAPDEIVVFDVKGVQLKAALFHFLPQIFHQLNVTNSPLRTVLDKVLDGNGEIEEWAEVLEDAVLDIIAQEIYTKMYDELQKIPKSTLALIEGETAKKMRMQAAEARRLVSLLEFSKDEETITRDLSKIDEIVAAQRYIQRYMTAVRSNLESVKRSFPALRDVESKLEAAKQKVVTNVCDEIYNLNEDSEMGPFAWGQLPTKDKPIGYRFSVSQDSTKRKDSQRRQQYIAKLEILVRLNTAEYIGACQTDRNLAFKAINTGITIDSIVRTETINSISKGFRRLEVEANTIISNITDARSAFNQLGLMGDWINDSPYWSVSGDFSKVEVILPLREVSQKVLLIDNGRFVLNLKQTGIALCNTLTTQVLPGVTEEWSKQSNIPIGKEWSLELQGKASASVAAKNCALFYQSLNQNESALPALATAELATEIKMALIGNIKGTPFRWNVTVFANILNDNISVKGYQFDHPPRMLLDLIEEYKNEVTSTIKRELPVDIAFIVNAPGYIETLKDFSLPVLVQISTQTCSAQSFFVSMTVKNLKISMSEDELKNSVVDLARCEGARIVRDNLVPDNTCDNLKLDIFGMGISAKDAGKEPLNGGGLLECELNVDTIIAGQSIKLRHIMVKVHEGGFGYDFSRVKDEGTLAPFVEKKIKNTLGSIAEKGLFLTNPRFSRNAFLVDVTLDRPELFGKLSLGTLTVHVSGAVNISAELDRILTGHVSEILKSKLEALARRALPKEVEKITINIGLPSVEGRLTASANIWVRAHKDLPPLPATISLLPTPDLEVKFDETVIKNILRGKMTNFLQKHVKFSSGPLTAGVKDVMFAPNFDITLIAFVNIKLDALGELKADPIYITRHGVKFGGRLEVRVAYALPLFATPPVFLTRPGVFYDFDEEQVGALGALTILAPPFNEILQIDVSLITDDPNGFLKQLILTGDLILLNTIPFVHAQGVMDFKNLQVTFHGRTSSLLEKIFSASIDGAFKPKDRLAEMSTHISLLDVNLFKTVLGIYVDKCPRRCIKGAAEADIGIGKGQMSVQFGPFLVDGIIAMGFELNLFGKELGKADFEAELLRAKLKATVFEYLKFSVTTPSKRQMTPEYIAAVIASLLNVDLKDILKWLENPEIKLSPAGNPSSGDEIGSDDGDSSDSDGNGNSGQSDAEKEAIANECCNGQVPTENDVTNSGNTSVLDDAPSSSRKVTRDGNAAAACDFNNLTWGYVYQWRGNSRRFYSSYYSLPRDAFDKICIKKNKPANLYSWGNRDVYYIDDNYRPIETVANFGASHSSLVVQKSDRERTYLASGRFPTFNVSYVKSAEGKKEHYRKLMAHGRLFQEVVTATKNRQDIELKIPKDDAERFESFFKALDGASNKCSVPKSDRRFAYFDRYIKGQIKKEKGHNVSCIESVDVSSGFLGFFGLSNEVTLEIKAQTFTNSRQYSDREYISFWLDRNNQNGVFVRKCGWKEMKEKCFSNADSFSQSTQRAMDSLGKLRSTIPPNEIVQLNMDETDWFLNDALPYIFTGKESPVRGVGINLDSNVASCDVSNITMTQDDERMKLRGRVNKERRSEYKNIVIDKLGQHEYWVNSQKPALVNAMANYLVCQENPEQWLQDHRIWLEFSDVEKGSSPILFTVLSQSTGEQHSLIDIQSGLPVKYYQVPKFNPYLREKGVHLRNEERRTIYDRIKNKDKAWIDIHINASQRIELVELHVAGKVSFEMRPFACVEYLSGNSNNCDSPLPLQGADSFNSAGFVNESDLTRCLRELPGARRTLNLKQLMAVANPIQTYGIGPVRLLRSLTNNQNISCGLH